MNPTTIIGSVTAGIIVTLVILLSFCGSAKDALIKEVSDLESSIDIQNQTIEDQRIDYEKRLKVYETAVPRTVYIPADVNMTRGNCDDVENLIDGIRNITF